ncbi:hypothetical protein AALP_AA8G307700 [Arabis alpina]|uniref:Timeless N-terminal domain-containing protein n=1 Tax=Arabis alpina TaxID=50452 RepID=A0A087GAJ5_ARAAL|nr:hypothetical protein AALP_AA8G307700 [Arabis alpina]
MDVEETKKKMDLEGLSVICSDLGVSEEDDDRRRIGYSKSDYCLDNLKDLLRFLRRDDPESREVFKQVCAWNIVSKDLIPIIEHYQDEHNLVLNAVKVLVFLTMPVEPDSDDIPQQIEYLWALKSAITFSNIVAVIVSLLEVPLENLESDVFNEEDWKLVQLVLTLFRNLLAIHDISALQKAGESTCYYLSLRDQFLELLSRENVMDIFLVITQTIEGSNSLLRHDNLLLLEIYHYILLGQDMELTAKAPQKLDQGKNASVDSLKKLMEEEQVKKKLARLHNMNQRRSQFGGTFTRTTMGGNKAVLKGIPSATESTILNPHKGRGATEKIVWENGPMSVTNDDVLKLLHDFINQFMSGGYNVLMQSVCEDIEKEHPSIQNSDIVTFFQVAQAVTSFQFHKSASNPAAGSEEPSELSTDQNAGGNFSKSDICAPIAATINDRMFMLVISKWRCAFDGLKETKDFKFLSAAGSLLKTMLCLLDLILRLLPEDSREAFTVRILLYKLFYDQTDQGMCQFILNLVRSFDTHKQPKSELGDLVESIHIIVGLMENLQGRGTLRVSKKSRKVRKKKPMRNKEATVHDLSENHPSTSNEASTAKSIPMNNSKVSPEDRSMDVPPNNPGDSNLGSEADETQQAHIPKSNHVVDDLSCGTDDSSDGEEQAATDEVDFKVSTFISAFASNSVIQNICWLLKFYKSNPKQTNHHIINILRRITEDLELSPMLYQLSLLITFHKILDEQKACPCKDYENIVTFLTDLVRNMLKKMKSQPLLFVEILFSKSRKECHYINAEYMLHELGHLRKQMGNQEKVSGTEENVSPSDKGWARRNLADALGDDDADVEISYGQGLQNEDDDIVENESAEPSKRKRKLVLDADMEIKLKELHEMFKDDKDCSRLIAETLDPDGGISGAQVTNKLKQLGLEKRKRLRCGDSSLETSEGKNGNDDPDHLSDRQPSDTRKRVSSFTKEQETLIKELYEKFKDQRRCCYLIANELGSEKTYTTAQVSRKLKQLGLRLPRSKKSEAGMMLKDDHDDSSADDSDNQTLLAFKHRKSRKTQKIEKHTRSSNDITPEGSEDNTERNETTPTNGKDEDNDQNYISRKSKEPHTDVHMSDNAPSTSSPEDPNLLSDHELEDDELGDSGDDAATVSASLTQSPLSRRKLKMVLDEDD